MKRYIFDGICLLAPCMLGIILGILVTGNLSSVEYKIFITLGAIGSTFLMSLYWTHGPKLFDFLRGKKREH